MPREISEVLAILQDIDEHVEPIAVQSPPESELRTLAFAVHNLVICVEEIAEHVAGMPR
jgi:hypothetical protein